MFTVLQQQFKCYVYTEEEQAQDLEESVICANAGGTFTGGSNEDYPGCDCSCCKGNLCMAGVTAAFQVPHINTCHAEKIKSIPTNETYKMY